MLNPFLASLLAPIQDHLDIKVFLATLSTPPPPQKKKKKKKHCENLWNNAKLCFALAGLKVRPSN